MDKYTNLKITKLEMSGFKCHTQSASYLFGDITQIRGANHTGKTTIADAIAFAVTGQGFFGGRFLDRYYAEGSRALCVTMDFLADGAVHTLARQRINDRMEIALDGTTVRQKDLNILFGDTDEFLSLFNPLYFINVIKDKGRQLLAPYLTVAHEDVMTRLNDETRQTLEGYTFLSPDVALKNTRAEIRELQDSLAAYGGRKELLSEQASGRALAVAQTQKEINALQAEMENLEKKKADGFNEKALREELVELSLRRDEMLADAPGTFDPDMYDKQEAQVLAKLRTRKTETYESKYAAEIEKRKGPLNALRLRHKQLETFLHLLKPGAVCPECFRKIRADEVVDCETKVKSSLAQCDEKGVALSLQQKELQALDAQSFQKFQEFQQQDISEMEKALEQIKAARAAAQTKDVQDRTEHARQLDEISAKINGLDERLSLGNWTPEEAARAKELAEQLIAKRASLQTLQESADDENSADSTYNMIQQELAQKNERVSALIDYASKRNELLFSQLHTEHVECRLYDVVKSTGEVVDAWHMLYNGRDYRYLSRSEQILAGMELTELLRSLFGRSYPVFLDDSESVDNIPRPSAQVFLARVARGESLQVKVLEMPRRTLPMAG